MTTTRPSGSGSLVFAGIGAALVAAAVLVYVNVSHPLATTILTVVLGSVLAGVVIRLLADLLLQATSGLKVLRQSQPSALLSRNRDRTPRFFRNPPRAVDFHMSYVIAHPQLQPLLAEVRRSKGGMILLEGHAASGKTSLLHALVFELGRFRPLRRRRRVFVISLKAMTSEELGAIRADLDRVPKRSVILFDDVHLHLSLIGSITQQYRDTSLVFVLATRLLSNYPREQGDAILDQRPSIYTTSAALLSDEIIRRYLKARSVLDVEIPNLSYIYDPYCHDLWVLTTALEATIIKDGLPTISREAINSRIIAKTLRSEVLGDRVVERAKILAPLAALYRFEVPAARDFLTTQIGASPADIARLVSAGEVLSHNDESYVLHHSSLADLMVDALSTQDGIGLVPTALRSMAHKYGTTWHEAAVRWQTEAVPLRSIRTLVGVFRANQKGRDLALRIRSQLDNKVFLESIDAAATDVETMGSFLELWGETGQPLDHILVRPIRAFGATASRTSVWSWSWLCCNLARLDGALAEPFADSLAEMLRREGLAATADVGTTLSYVSPGLAKRVVRNTDPELLIQALRSSPKSAEELAQIFAKLVWVEPSIAEAIRVPLLELFPRVTADTFPIILSRLAWGSPEVARQLLEASDTGHLMRVIRSADNPLTRYRLLASVANVSLDTARRLVRAGASEWQDEIGMRRLTDRILEFRRSDHPHVHTVPVADDLSDSRLAAARNAIRGAVASGTGESLHEALKAVERAHDRPQLLRALSTMKVEGDGTDALRSWAESLLRSTNSTSAGREAYLRCVGLIGE